MKSIVLITTGQPSTNPRLVKEAISLRSAGYRVTVLYSYWIEWALKTDESIIAQNPSINWLLVGGSPHKRRYLYLASKLIQKVSSLLAKLFKNNVELQIASSFRNYFFMLTKAKKVEADLYIGHNLGALPVASKIAKKKKKKCGFDFEDYHLGQVQNDSNYQFQTKLIEDRFLKNVSYTTAASPLIASEYKKRYPSLNPVTINNVFSRDFAAKKNQPFLANGVLKIFWFSQTVGINRGLEELIVAIGLLKNENVELGLLGSCSETMKNSLLKLAEESGLRQEQIVFHQPVELKEIFAIASQYHIGMALEVEQTINRQICLTNKIFAYLLSGLAIVATNTPAQQYLLTKYPDVGRVYITGDVVSLSSIIMEYYSKPDILNKHRKNSLLLAKENLNWETEASIFLQVINNVISN